MRTPAFYQAQTTECGVAALAIVLGYFGRWVTMDEIRDATGVSRDGTNAADLVRVARAYGLRARGRRVTPDELGRLGLPLIAHLGFIHFVVVEKVGRTHVHLNDPARGRYRLSREEFAHGFTGVVIEFEPGEGFRPGGRRWRLSRWIGGQAAGLAAPVAAVAAAGMSAGLATAGIAALVAALPAGAAMGAGGAMVWLAAAVAARLAAAWALEGGLIRIERALSARTSDFLRHLMALPFAFFTYRLPIDLHALVTAGDDQAARLVRHVLRALATGIGLPVVVAALLVVSPGLGAAILAVAGLYGLAGAVALRLGAGDRNGASVTAETYGAYLAHHVRGIEMYRTGGRDRDVFALLADDFAQQGTMRQRCGRMDAWTDIAHRGAQSLLVAVAVVAATAIPGPSLAAVIAAHLLGLHLIAAVREMIAAGAVVERLGRTARQLDQVATAVEDVPAGRDAPQSGPARGDVRVRSLTFGYSPFRPPLLAGLSFTATAGSQVGIAGESGCGKSTLAALLTGLHRPWEGTVELDGRPVGALPRRVLARTVGWVHKTPLLFEGTLRDNITLWDPAVDEEDVAAAIRDACLDDVIRTRSGGVDTHVAAQGANFSGGQRQRVEIARALARNVAVLILDEAHDALEADLEERIRANIRRRGCTLIIISHRESTLKACDAVLTLEGGRIATVPASGEEDGIGPFAAPTPEPAEPPRGVAAAALEAAFRAVADAAKVALPEALTSASLPAEGEAAAAALADRCGVRAKRVRLIRRDWWRQDHGPLLAFIHGEPAALLPAKGGYVLVAQGSATRVDATVAARLDCHKLMLLAAHDQARSGMALARRLARDRAAACAGVVLLATAAALAAVVAPLAVLVTPVQAGAGPWLAAVAAAVAARLGLDAAAEAGLLRLTGRVQMALAASLFDRMIRLPGRFFRRHAAEDLGYRLSAAALAVDRGPGGNLAGLLALPTGLAGAFLAGVLVPPILPALMLAAGLAVAIPVLALRRALALEATRLDLNAGHRQMLLDALHGFARLRVLSSEGRVAARWRAAWAAERKLAFAQHAAGLPARALNTTMLAVPALMAGVAATASLSPPVLLGAYLGLSLCLLAAREVGEGLAAALRTRFQLGRADMLLAEPPEPPAPAGPAPAFTGAIALRDVRYRYEESTGTALDGVSLEVAPGEVLALTGPSGGGKSTVLRLLAGLEQPQHGSVLYDGRPIDMWGAAALRGRIGAVLQEDRLTVATARFNIAGAWPGNLDDTWEAARLAAIDGELERMPMGIQTILEDERLSTGQKQRLLIAARLLRRPRVLLLDEATSALHDNAQRRIFANVRRLGMTCVCVSHRAETIALADRVAVIDRGRVTRVGPATEPPGRETDAHATGKLSGSGARPAAGHRRDTPERRVFLSEALDEFQAPIAVEMPLTVTAPRTGTAITGALLLLAAAGLLRLALPG